MSPGCCGFLCGGISNARAEDVGVGEGVGERARARGRATARARACACEGEGEGEGEGDEGEGERTSFPCSLDPESLRRIALLRLLALRRRHEKKEPKPARSTRPNAM